MAVDSTNVPLFAGLEDKEQMFLATMEELDREVHSHIDIQAATWQFLKKRNLIEYRNSIGTHVPVRLMFKENATVKDHTHYDDVDNTPSDALDEAKFAYGSFVGVQMYSREEMIKNTGPEQLIDLVKTKTEQLRIAMSNHFHGLIMGTQVADGRKMTGLGNILARDTACGGIDPATDGYAEWNPVQTFKTGTTKFALASEFRQGMRKLYRTTTLYGVKPSVLICGEDLYDAHQAWAENILRLSMDEIKDSSGWGDFEMFDLNGTTVIYDETLGAKIGWAVDFRESVKLRVHRGSNMSFTPWESLPGKLAKKRNCITVASLYCRNRRNNGTIEFS